MHSYDDFFMIQEAFQKDAIRVEPISTILDPHELFHHGLGESVVTKFRVISGRRNVDFVGCNLAPLVLVSQLFMDVASHAALSGWATYEVEVGNLPRPQKYYGLVIRGQCGPIDDSLSLVRVQSLPDRARTFQAAFGLFFDLETWDGSSLFAPTGTSYVFCSKNAKEAIERAGLINLKFIPIRECENFNLTLST